MLAAVAELEAGMIGERTKAALAAAKARGVKLGNPRPRGATPGMERAATAARMARAEARLGTAAGDRANTLDRHGFARRDRRRAATHGRVHAIGARFVAPGDGRTHSRRR